ncbi:MAG: tetratricopeptide repeat protein, partial [Cyanobacteria bacterium J06649_11]
ITASLSLPVYGQSSSQLNRKTPFSLAQGSTADADKLFEGGVELFRQGRYFQAIPVYQRVLEIRRQQGNKAEAARILNNIGEVYLKLDENEKANQFLQEALAIRRQLKDVKGEGETLNHIGYVYFTKKEYDKSLKLLQSALAISRRVNDRKGEGRTLANIGIVYSFGFNKDAEASKFLEQAFRIHQEVGDKYQAGFTLYNLAQIYGVLNQYPRAFEVLEKAKLINNQIDNSVAEVKRFAILSWLHFRQQDKKLAIQFGEQALGLARKNNLRLEELRRLNWLLIVYSTTNISPKTLIDYAQNAVNLARELKKPKLEADALNNLAQGYIALKDYEKAL